MNIDWSKAPEGATHFIECTDAKFLQAFFAAESEDRYTKVGAETFFRKRDEGRPDWIVTPRPVTWNSKGLPPVGTVCAVLNSDLGNPTWERCTILYSGKHRVIYDSESCEERVAFIEDLKFRAARMPEQIAEDKRIHLILNARTDINKRVERYNISIDCYAAMLAVIEAMIDAGYRKP